MPEPALPQRRRSFLLLCMAPAIAVALSGCAGAPVPPTVWLRLPAQMPASTSQASMPAAASRDVWQLMMPLPIPAHLDRDSLFIPTGAGGASGGASGGALVRPLAAARWIEPLREALPRLLREDLSLLMREKGGSALWQAPLPAGLVPTRQLRVEITAFEIAGDGQTLLTRARWSLADAAAGRAPGLHETSLTTRPARSDEAEAWALAHREAIATLAARIAATMAAP